MDLFNQLLMYSEYIQRFVHGSEQCHIDIGPACDSDNNSAYLSFSRGLGAGMAYGKYSLYCFDGLFVWTMKHAEKRK
jgi:hypothetical protein